MIDSVLYDKADQIAMITLNRPATRNALTPEMLCLLADIFVDFRDDRRLRVAVLSGVGDVAFCSGGDLGSTLPLMTGARQPMNEFERRMLEDPAVMAAASLRDFPLNKPIVAAINGASLAGGFEIMLGTDIRVAAEHATFGLPEVRHGLVPFAGSMVRLPRQIPYANAMEMLLTGRSMTATDALRCGLVNYVLPLASVRAKALELAEQIAGNGPLAVEALKQTVREASGLPLEIGYRLEDRTKKAVFASSDAREGPLAFMEKRRTNFAGR